MITTRGVTYLSSELLDQVQGVRHGFSTRVGGLSPAPWRSLNLGFRSGDDEQRIQDNWRRFLSASGFASLPLVHLDQVHSATALPVAHVPDAPIHCAGEGDALFTDLAGVALAVLGADCMPLLVVAGSPARVGGAIHAGWRGVRSGVVPAAVRRMLDQAAPEVGADELAVAIGPHIRSCCFEVGPDVVAEFDRAGQLHDGDVRPGEGDRVFLDLTRIVMRQLAELGVPADRIEAVRHCTRCRPDLFYSFRGEGPNRGMQSAVVSLEA
jgi:YfiH family protein